MKNEITLRDAWTSTDTDRETVEMIISAIKAPAEWTRKYYSVILGKKISMHQTWLITNVQLALAATIVLGGQSVVMGIASVAWLARAIWHCKHAL